RPDSERLDEDEVANLNGPVFEPVEKRRMSELQEACAWDDRLPAPDDMLAQQPMCSGVQHGVKERLPDVVAHAVAKERARAGQIARCRPVTLADQRREHAHLLPSIPVDAEGAGPPAPSCTRLR